MKPHVVGRHAYYFRALPGSIRDPSVAGRASLGIAPLPGSVFVLGSDIDRRESRFACARLLGRSVALAELFDVEESR